MKIFDLGKSVSDTVGKGIDKITSDRERLEQANKLLENTKEIDLEQIKNSMHTNNFNPRNTRHWLELICVFGFCYTLVAVPIINDVFDTNLAGLDRGLQDLLYALFGLGGYRIAEKVIRK